MQKTSRVISDPEILGGTPVVEGTRVPVNNVLAAVYAGNNRAEIHHHYPSLPSDGIDACITWHKENSFPTQSRRLIEPNPELEKRRRVVLRSAATINHDDEAEELEILTAHESGKLEPVPDMQHELELHRAAAKVTLERVARNSKLTQ